MEILSEEKRIVRKIKSIQWDNRVNRPGFLQSKVIVGEAEVTPVVLTKNISLKYDNQMWVKDHCLYDEVVTKSFEKQFLKAFEEDKNWPVRVIEKFNLLTEEKTELVKKLLNVKATDSKNSRKDTIPLFRAYRNLLHSIQKYYVIAVPLTNYCEERLKAKKVNPLPIAVPYKKFDVDRYLSSVKNIQKAKVADRSQLIKKHLEEYAWIKTSYNIISPYTEKDLTEELEKEIPNVHRSFTLPHNCAELATGLQVGIYLRNRMKELSQQLWYAVDGLGNLMARIIGIGRDDFFQLLFQEAVDSFERGACVVSESNINARHRGFVAGFLGNSFVLLTGLSVEELNEYYNGVTDTNITKISGNVACKGLVRGKVKLVLSRKDFAKFETDEILVTSMTTPDFILLMKKAAAIVTNEGGLSSHAAIVSRELGVPCVIGTKIATKVFKDGDVVEVDANSGIIRLLKV